MNQRTKSSQAISILEREKQVIRHSLFSLFITAVAGLLCISPIQAAPLATSSTFHAGRIAEVDITLSSTSDVHTIELKNFNRETRPALYLLDENGNQIAVSEASGNRLVVAIDGQTAGTFTAVIRNGKTSPVQTADVWVDGELLAENIEFSSGTVFSITPGGSLDQLSTIPTDADGGEHVVYFISPDGRRILKRARGNMTSESMPEVENLLVVFGSLSPKASGRLRVLRNNLIADTDGDGLSDALELAIGTCGSKSGSVAGVECSELADARDTDGDGLQDGWEVLGKTTTWTENGVVKTEFLPLQQWGANPRHKDIFVEVDFRRLNLAENQSGLAKKMSPMIARQLAAIYADAATTNFFAKLRHAVSVNNPDRRPGISLHLDTGVAATNASDAKIFGNWGGYNPVNAVQVGGEWVPQRPEVVWKQQMSRGRWGVFRYVMGYTSGGGACGAGIACGFNMADAGNSAHEFGHSLTLDHNGPMGTHEPNCKPNYPSLMNYAYLGSGYRQFSDGTPAVILNNHALKESGAVSASNTTLLTTLRDVFKYKVDNGTGSVDWNRDGIFAAADRRVRAYANYQPGGNCEFTREAFKDSGLRSSQSPAVVYFRDKLLVFSIGANSLVDFTFTTTPWICPPATDACPDPVFAPIGPLPIGPVRSIDAKPFRINNLVEQIIVTGIRPDGSIVELPVILDSIGHPAWGTITTIAGPGTAKGELTLAVSQSKTSLAMAYKAPDNSVRLRLRSTTGWSAETTPRVGGQPIVMAPAASPGLAYTRLPIGATAINEKLVGGFADANGVIQLYSPGQIGGGWQRIPIPYGTMVSPVGRPLLAWVGPVGGVAPTLAASAQSTTVGRFYILYLQKPTNPNDPRGAVRMAMSHVDAAGTFRIGLDSYFDNVWSFGFGMGAVQPSEGAFRTVVSSGVDNSLRTVHLRPHSDGISDLAYRSYDDWKTLGWASCSILVPEQSGTPVQCSPKW